MSRLQAIARLGGKLRGNLELLARDPEGFGRNLLQFTQPALYEKRLLDVMTAAPMHISVGEVDGPPALNVLQPILSPSSMTGGPNTIVNLAFRAAQHGIRVRIVTTRNPGGIDERWFWNHLSALTGTSSRPPDFEVASAADPSRPLPIGRRDIFLATHWTTAQQVKHLLPEMIRRELFYFIQDYEPGFYAWSSNYALALETYDLPYRAIVNESFLADFLVERGIGRFAEPGFRERCLVFEPAVDRRLFHPPAQPRVGPKRLLFYARSNNARNMLGLGIQALRAAVAHPVFGNDEWEFLSIGSRDGVPELTLDKGRVLKRAPWESYESYAELLRNADVLLGLMLSPHTSYPVIEMAATGGLVVTNSFVGKPASSLRAWSKNLIAVPPTLEGIVAGLVEAGERMKQGRPSAEPLALSGDWGDTLAPVAAGVAAMFRDMTAG